MESRHTAGSSRSRGSRSAGSNGTRMSEVDVEVPAGCFAGDAFIAEVDGKELQIIVPENCGPGSIVTIEVQARSFLSKIEFTESDRIKFDDDAVSSHRGSDFMEVDVIVPEGKQAGDMFFTEVGNRTLAIVVPEDSGAGEMLTITGEAFSSRSQASEMEANVAVPEGLTAGDTFFAEINGRQAEVCVPEGSGPGSILAVAFKRVSGASTMEVEVTVPDNCKAGDDFLANINGKEMKITVPEGYGPGSVIGVALPPSRNASRTLSDYYLAERTSTLLTTEVDVIVPDGCKPGDCFLADVGSREIVVTVPEGCGPGSLITLGIGTGSENNSVMKSETGSVSGVEVIVPDGCNVGDNFKVEVRGKTFEVQVPPGCGPGSLVTLGIERGSEDASVMKSETGSVSGVEVAVPEWCKVGDNFTVEVHGKTFEVQVPPGCGPGSLVALGVERGSEDTSMMKPDTGSVIGVNITVPEGCKVGDTFMVEVRGKKLEARVPPGCGPGSVLTLGLDRESGSISIIKSETGSMSGVEVIVPEGCEVGDDFKFEVGGKDFEGKVPPGSSAGSVLHVDISSKSRTSAQSQEIVASAAWQAATDVLVQRTATGASAKSGIIVQPTALRSTTGSSVEVDLIVPDDCGPGDIILADVGGRELEVFVPAECGPGSKVTIALGPESVSAGRFDTDLSSLPLLPRQSTELSVEVEVCVPDGVGVGDMFIADIAGREMEILVPEGCGPGSLLKLDLGRSHTESDSGMMSVGGVSAKRERTSSTVAQDVEITIPLDCQGDTFVAEVAGRQIELPVPDGCRAGDKLIISLHLPSAQASEAGGAILPGRPASASSIRPESASSLKPPSGSRAQRPSVRSLSGRSGQSRPGSSALSRKSRASSAGSTMVEVGIVVPDGAQPGETIQAKVGGKDIELTLPPGASPGSTIMVSLKSRDILNETASPISRPASPTSETAASTTTTIEVQLGMPEELKAGELFEAEIDGDVMEFEVPDDILPGSMLTVSMKKPRKTVNERFADRQSTGDSRREHGVLECDVEIPPGYVPGDVFEAEIDGKIVEVTVPDGCYEGMVIAIDLPSVTCTEPPTPPTALPTKEAAYLDTIEIGVTVPVGCQPGDVFDTNWDGRTIQVTVPPNCRAGSVMTVEVPVASKEECTPMDQPTDASSREVSKTLHAKDDSSEAVKIEPGAEAEAEAEARSKPSTVAASIRPQTQQSTRSLAQAEAQSEPSTAAASTRPQTEQSTRPPAQAEAQSKPSTAAASTRPQTEQSTHPMTQAEVQSKPLTAAESTLTQTQQSARPSTQQSEEKSAITKVGVTSVTVAPKVQATPAKPAAAVVAKVSVSAGTMPQKQMEKEDAAAKKAEEQQRLEKETAAAKQAEEQQRLEKDAAAARQAEEQQRLLEKEAAAAKQAEDRQRLEKEAARQAEEQQRLEKEAAAAKQAREQQRLAAEAAAAERQAKEQLEKEAAAAKQAEDRQRLEKEAARQAEEQQRLEKEAAAAKQAREQQRLAAEAAAAERQAKEQLEKEAAVAKQAEEQRRLAEEAAAAMRLAARQAEEQQEQLEKAAAADKKAREQQRLAEEAAAVKQRAEEQARYAREAAEAKQREKEHQRAADEAALAKRRAEEQKRLAEEAAENEKKAAEDAAEAKRRAEEQGRIAKEAIHAKKRASVQQRLEVQAAAAMRQAEERARLAEEAVAETRRAEEQKRQAAEAAVAKAKAEKEQRKAEEAAATKLMIEEHKRQVEEAAAVKRREEEETRKANEAIEAANKFRAEEEEKHAKEAALAKQKREQEKKQRQAEVAVAEKKAAEAARAVEEFAIKVDETLDPIQRAQEQVRLKRAAAAAKAAAEESARSAQLAEEEAAAKFLAEEAKRVQDTYEAERKAREEENKIRAQASAVKEEQAARRKQDHILAAALKIAGDSQATAPQVVSPSKQAIAEAARQKEEAHKKAEQQRISLIAQEVLREAKKEPLSVQQVIHEKKQHASTREAALRADEEFTAAKWIAEADAILLCVGSGSVSAPSFAAGSRMFVNKADFKRRHRWLDARGVSNAAECLDVGKMEQMKQEDKWRFWASHAQEVRWNASLNQQTMKTFTELTSGKNYFIYTTSADGCFEQANFDAKRIYKAAGDWAYYQCARPCGASSVYESRRLIDKMCAEVELTGMLAAESLPRCQRCGGHSIPNVRISNLFSPKMYEKGRKRFIEWLDDCASNNSKLAVLEVDSCFKVDRLSRCVMESIACELPGTALIRMSTLQMPFVPSVLPKAVSLPAKTFLRLPQIAAAVATFDGQLLSAPAEQTVLGEIKRKRQQRKEESASSDPIHWRRILDHLSDNIFNETYEWSM
eukprot:TRINITY_DN7240_c0_g1_i2.p1 TRINITY_DN7240_c0_g1~~TRINITY_DN7240_c0_g1_i2.p1  ORF type:complete len:2333 (+),score=612.73 TRINITY_DN7240_c0_g1_i2:51-7049(+)